MAGIAQCAADFINTRPVAGLFWERKANGPIE
jgi:hypothetical protein